MQYIILLQNCFTQVWSSPGARFLGDVTLVLSQDTRCWCHGAGNACHIRLLFMFHLSLFFDTLFPVGSIRGFCLLTLAIVSGYSKELVYVQQIV